MNDKLFEIILVSGEDQIDFLQGQITQDIEKINTSSILNGAFCNPKGRVISTCQLFKMQSAIAIIIPQSMAEPLIKRLNLYKLRSKVSIEKSSQISSYCIKNNELFNEVTTISHKLPRTDHSEVIGDFKSDNFFLTTLEWREVRVKNGIIDIDIKNSEKFTPHMLNLDLTNAISFRKGCYVGQEIIARTQHIGKVKRRAVYYNLTNSSPPNNSEFSLNGNPVTISIITIVNNTMVAVVNTSISKEILKFEGGHAVPINLDI
ncbi:MAG: hypothetical protein P8O19_00110 [Woeseiaceae bacterium]|jgi:tRNA-modifying protein YgfZ|nr:hypothetical protein [Woeseiaceae bacterium]MDG1866126.1 hypothetical protein [Woeseiaceae bacterium]